MILGTRRPSESDENENLCVARRSTSKTPQPEAGRRMEVMDSKQTLLHLPWPGVGEMVDFRVENSNPALRGLERMR